MAKFDNRNTWDDIPSPSNSKDQSPRSSMDNYTKKFIYDKRRRLREYKPSIVTTIRSGGYSDYRSHECHKREKFRERNRLAASKCRQKKKKHAMMLESRLKEEWDKRKRLKLEIALLCRVIFELKNEALQHDCILFRWLKNIANEG